MENSIDHIITRILSGNSSSEDFLSLSEWLNADEKNKKEFRLLKIIGMRKSRSAIP